MLALYYLVPGSALAIRAKLPEISFFEAAAMGEIGQVLEDIERDSALLSAFAGADVNLAANNARQVAPIHAACARQDLEILQPLLAP